MTRIIKLQPHYRQHKYKSMPVRVPKLTLCGNWMEQAGFKPYQTVYVTVENGKMIITARE